jgi:hypothetical protein
MPRSSAPILPRRNIPQRFLRVTAVLVALLFASALRSDEPAAEVVGSVEGADIAVKGPISVEVTGGLSRTMVSSGSEITVKSGQARMDLTEGGAIGICGPAHLSLLKSSGALTVALDYGSIHAQLGFHPALTVYTPLIAARAVDIGGRRDIVAGLKPTGEMCLGVSRGAVRIEQQLTGQNMIIPQGGEVSFADGQIQPLPADGTHCTCEILSAKDDPPASAERREVSASALGSAKDVRPNLPPPRPAYTREASTDNGDGNGKLSSPPAVEEPVYKVYMPPLTFDAASPAPPPLPGAETILLVRTVRVRPSVVFRGHVEPARETMAAKPSPTPAEPPENPPPPVARTSPQKPSVMTRMKDFLRRLWK